MKRVSAKISDASDQPPLNCVVAPMTTFGEVVDQIDLQCVPFVLVQDAEGNLLGIVESSLIHARLSAPNAVERERWRQMPVEAALQWKISPCTSAAEATPHQSLPVDCTAVSSDDGVVALVSEQDIFLSWQSVRESLTEATTDTVTNLPNRSVFQRRGREEIDRAARNKYSLAVVLIDIDHFKEVNDSFGHSVGDAALQAIAGLLQQELRSYDILTRYGGDEFAAICSSCSEGEIDIPLRRIRSAMKTGFATKAIALPPITLSIGAVVVHEVSPFQTLDELVEMADMCLYRAKDHGRNCAFKLELLPDQPNVPQLVAVSSATHMDQPL